MKRKKVRFASENQIHVFNVENEEEREVSQSNRSFYEDDDTDSPMFDDRIEQYYLRAFENEFNSFSIGAFVLTEQPIPDSRRDVFWRAGGSFAFDQKQSEDSQKLLDASERVLKISADELKNNEPLGKESADDFKV